MARRVFVSMQCGSLKSGFLEGGSWFVQANMGGRVMEGGDRMRRGDDATADDDEHVEGEDKSEVVVSSGMSSSSSVCEFSFCPAKPCLYPQQAQCKQCAPKLLTEVVLRKDQTKFWAHTSGAEGEFGRESYKKALQTSLEGGIYLTFDKEGVCDNDDEVRGKIMMLMTRSMQPNSNRCRKTWNHSWGPGGNKVATPLRKPRWRSSGRVSHWRNQETT